MGDTHDVGFEVVISGTHGCCEVVISGTQANHRFELQALLGVSRCGGAVDMAARAQLIATSRCGRI